MTLPAMVILALVVAIFTVGLVVVAGVVARRSLMGLRRQIDAVQQQLEPLRQELEAEQATTQLELDGLQQRLRNHRR